MAGIKLDFGFERTADEPIDASQTLSKAEMLAMDDSKMPNVYFAVCKDDKKMYVYDKSATPSAETGKFSVYGGGGTSGALKAIRGTTTTTEIIEAINAGRDILVYWTAADDSPRLVTKVDIDSPYLVYLSCVFTTTSGDTYANLFRVHTDVETTWTYESRKLNYAKGDGIDITNNVISADFATDAEIEAIVTSVFGA